MICLFGQSANLWDIRLKIEVADNLGTRSQFLVILVIFENIFLRRVTFAVKK